MGAEHLSSTPRLPFSESTETGDDTRRHPRMSAPMVFHLMPVTISCEPILGGYPVIVCCSDQNIIRAVLGVNAFSRIALEVWQAIHHPSKILKILLKGDSL